MSASALRRAYPQVDPRAAGVVDVPLVAAPATARVGEALARARRHAAGLVAVGDAVVLVEDLARASLLGLDALEARRLARRLPTVEAGASEIAARRRAAGAPVLLVVERGRPLGGIRAPAPEPVPLGARWLAPLPAAVAPLLEALGRLAHAQGARAFLVGGLVRELLRGAAPGAGALDLDVVVEGDGLALARALARELGVGERDLVEHGRFLTASLTHPDLGRVDVATARAERYEAPGALPRVVPASIGQDLARRDFTVNAMALELAPGGPALLDPFGGRADLARRRLRALHPLAFVEDPTRIFRAARYAARLGFGLDAPTREAIRLALELAPYPALSGQRLLAELERIVADAHPDRALRRLGAAGVFRLLAPGYRFTRATAARVAALPATLAWAAAHGLRAAPVEVALLALLADQPPAVAHAALRRLALGGEPLARLERALARPPAPPDPDAPPSARARRLRACSDLELARLALEGGPAVRAALDWYLDEARHVRPALRGDDVVALGVAPGPDVARVLAELRDARLDGRVEGREAEEAYVRARLTATEGGRTWPSSTSS